MGDIINAEIVLSDMGKIVNTEFLKSFDIRNELFLYEYVIMPNHIHTIVEICHPVEPDVVKPHGHIVEPHGRAVLQYQSNEPNIVESHGRAVLQESNPNDLPIKRNPPIRLPKSISSFVAGFKSAVNTKIDDYIDEQNLPIPKYNRNNHFFQPNYHDHVIRNNFEYQRIANYIIQNPVKWEDDTLNSVSNG
jgi:REP element-mobilizing transposase RayT